MSVWSALFKTVLRDVKHSYIDNKIKQAKREAYTETKNKERKAKRRGKRFNFHQTYTEILNSKTKEIHEKSKIWDKGIDDI